MLPKMLVWAAVLVAAAPPAFEVASIKPGDRVSGRDGEITTNPGSLSAHDVNLKRLIGAAYQVQYDQISGGPSWLDSDAFDLNAKSSGPSSKNDLMLMLQTLLTERFHLALHSETKESKVYALMVGKNGPKLDSAARPLPGTRTYQCDLQEFAAILTIQLSIPMSNNPAEPSRASGAATPVIDKTGIAGVHKIDVAVS